MPFPFKENILIGQWIWIYYFVFIFILQVLVKWMKHLANSMWNLPNENSIHQIYTLIYHFILICARKSVAHICGCFFLLYFMDFYWWSRQAQSLSPASKTTAKDVRRWVHPPIYIYFSCFCERVTTTYQTQKAWQNINSK